MPSGGTLGKRADIRGEGLQVFGPAPAPEVRSVGKPIYETLRLRIINMELPPGASLSRKALADEFGVSLTPVREALQQLEQDGLVRVRPQSGTVVRRIDRDQLEESQFLRLAVETEVVRRLASAADPTITRRARAILDMQATLLGDLTAMDMFTELDHAFHKALFEAIGMENLHAMVARRMGHLARCQRLELPHAGKMQDILAAHRQILDAIEAGDPQGAADAMAAHLTGTIRRLDVLGQEHPEAFTDTARRAGQGS